MKRICAFISTCIISSITNAQTITTIAGTGWTGYTGDGGPATAARLHDPNQVAIHSSGNVYISDACNNVIRKVSTAGIITTVAGTGYMAGSCGGGDFTGDGGPALSARFRAPLGVTVDPSGNVYVCDGNEIIRKVNTSGIVNKFAGRGYHTTCLPFNGDGGPATASEIIYAYGAATDAAGNVYFISETNAQVRKVNTSGIITTVAGNGTTGYSGDGGPATTAKLNNPQQVAVDNIGNIYIADKGNVVIRKVNTSGIISTIAGNGLISGTAVDGVPATATSFWQVEGVGVDASGNIYIADGAAHRIRKVSTTGLVSTFAGTGAGGAYSGYSGDYGAATAAYLYHPTRLAIDASGNVFFVDYGNQVIRKINVLITPISGISSICIGDSTTLTDVSSGGSWSSGATSVATVGSSSGVVRGISAGNAIISHTTTSGLKIINITVKPTPTLASSLHPPAVCDSEMLLYSVGGTITGSTFVWSRAIISGISNPPASGTGNILEYLDNTSALPIAVSYVYTLTAAGCGNVQTVTATINPTPQLSSSLTPPAICDSTIFAYVPTSTSPSVTYAWYQHIIPGILPAASVGTGNISMLLENTTSSPLNAMFEYRITYPGCYYKRQDVYVTVLPPCVTTGVSFDANAEKLEIYPNPTQDEFTVVSNAIGHKCEISIFSMSGRLLKTYELKNNYFTISTASYPPGVYLCKIIRDGEVIIRKVVIN